MATQDSTYARNTKAVDMSLVAQYLASERCDPRVRQYLQATLAGNSQRAYQGDLNHFLAWGGSIPATPESVACYLAHYANKLANSTLARRLVAIARAHTSRGLASPTESELVRATLRGVRRAHGSAVRQVAALQKAQLVQMVRGLKRMAGLRDKALLLFGFASALRRSELVALNVEDIRFVAEGAVIRLRRCKTDQEGRGRDIAIPSIGGRNCPVRSLQAWLKAAEIKKGAIFRRINRYEQVLPERLAGQSVALIVKQRAAAVGLDPTMFSGHSLRAGFVTNAARNGASAMAIRRQTGHKSDSMLQRYVRDPELFSNNPNLMIW